MPFLTLWIEFSRMPVLRHHGGIRRIAVVEDAVEVDMCEGIEMRMRDAVIADRDAIGTNPVHRDLVRIGIVDCFYGIDVSGQRHGDAIFHQTGRLLALRRRDQVQRANLIVFSPASPVRERLLPLFVFAVGDDVAGRRCRLGRQPADTSSDTAVRAALWKAFSWPLRLRKVNPIKSSERILETFAHPVRNRGWEDEQNRIFCRGPARRSSKTASTESFVSPRRCGRLQSPR